MPTSNSLKKQIIKYTIIQTFLLISIISLISGYILYQSELKNAKLFLQESNKNIRIFIQGYFKEIVDSIKILSKNRKVIEYPYLSEQERSEVLKLYNDFEEANEHIHYIYSGYTNKILAINNYTPPDGFDLTKRPWYRAVMNNPARNKMVVGLLYKEAKSKEWILSTVKILESPQHGFTGVVAIDSHSRYISNLLQDNKTPYKSTYSYVTTAKGKLIVHPNQKIVGTNLLQLINLNQPPLANTFFEYQYQGKTKIAYVSQDPLTRWLIFTAVEKKDLVIPILKKIGIYFLVLNLTLILSAYITIVIWFKKFIEPIKILKRRIEEIVKKKNPSSNLKMPNNEIGEIARSIEKITDTALYIEQKKLERAYTKIKIKNIELQKIASYDFLTGIFNRKKIEEALNNEYEKFLRYQQKFSLILFDIDNFKSINDNFGHKAGDKVLKEVASLVKNNIRKIDLFGRWGGEEFLLVAPNTTLSQIKNLAEKLCHLVAKYDFGFKQPVTISLGFAQIKTGETVEELIKRVDKYLYQAKKAGKNQARGEVN